MTLFIPPSGNVPAAPLWVPPVKTRQESIRRSVSRRQVNEVSPPAEIRYAQVTGKGKPRRIIFGEDRVGAYITGIVTEYLLVTLPIGTIYRLDWCAGPCESVAVKINGEAPPAGVTVTTYLGNPGQGVDPDLAAQIPGYADDMPGHCYSVVKVPYGKVQGFPRFEAEIKGRNDIPDPRAGGATGWTDNPGLIAAFFATEYMGRPVLDADVTALANACDEDLGGGVKRRTMNYTITRSAPAEQHMEALRAMAGAFVWDDGQYLRFLPDAPVRKALELDGTGDYATAADAAALDITGDMTIMAWVRVDDWGAVSHPGLVLKGSSQATSPWQLRIGMYDTPVIRFAHGDGVSSASLDVSAVDQIPGCGSGYWFHLAATRSAGTAKIYVNLVEKASGDLSSVTPAANSASVRLGQYSTDLDGALCDVRLYNIALDLDTLKTEATRSPTGGETGLVAAWLTDGTNADATGNGHTLTLQGGATHVPGPPTLAMLVTDNDLVEEPEIRRRHTDDAPNYVRVIYSDRSVATRWRDGVAEQKLAGAGTPGDPIRPYEIRLTGIQTYDQADREAIRLLNGFTLVDLEVRFAMRDRGMLLEPGDVIGITWANTLSAKALRVMGVEEIEPGRFRIQAEEYQPGIYSDDIQTAPSLVDSTLPDPAVIAAPTGLNIVEELYQRQDGTWRSRFRVSWTAAEYAYLHTYRVTMTAGGTAAIPAVFTADTETVLVPIVEGTEYTISVIAVNQQQRTSTALTDTKTAVGVAPPTAPASLTLTRIGVDTIRASWPASVDTWAERYEIRTGGTWSGGTVQGTTKGLQFDLVGQPIGSSVTVRVKAFGAAQYSSSDRTSSTTLALPSEPASLSLQRIGVDAIRASWPASVSPYVAGYEVRTGGTGWADATVEGNTGALSFDLTGQPINTSITVRVKTLDQKGNYSTSARTNSITLPRPDTVTGLKGYEAAGRTYLRWTANTDRTTGYRIAYGVEGIAQGSATTLGTVGKTDHYSTGEVPNGRWDFLVWGVDDKGIESATAARYTLTVTSDDKAFFIDRRDFNFSPATGWTITSSQASANNPGSTAVLVSGNLDAGSLVDAKWWIPDADISTTGSVLVQLELSTDASSWDVYGIDEPVYAQYRYARFRCEVDPGESATLQLPLTLSIDAVTRDESHNLWIWASNKFSQFDGANDHAYVADHADLDITGDWGCSAWIRIDDGTISTHTIMSKGDSQAVASYGVYLQPSQDRIVYFHGNGTNASYSIATGVATYFPEGQWCHVAVWRRVSNRMIYIRLNGKLVLANQYSSGVLPQANSDNLYFGLIGASRGEFSISNVRLYASTAPLDFNTEDYSRLIMDDWNGGGIGFSAGLVAFWFRQGKVGGVYKDHAGTINGYAQHDLTEVGAITDIQSAGRVFMNNPYAKYKAIELTPNYADIPALQLVERNVSCRFDGLKTGDPSWIDVYPFDAAENIVDQYIDVDVTGV